LVVCVTFGPFVLQPTEEALAQDGHNNLHISATLGACPDNPDARCIISVRVFTQNREVIVEGNKVYLNGRVISLPYSDDVIYIKQATSLLLIIRGFSFSVTYDGNQRLYANLGPYYENKVSHIA